MPSRPRRAPASKEAPRVLKKYPNRRLYDTHTSSYITLADVKKMVLAGQDFIVRDAKTGDDLTRSILLQIILEEETGGVPMFSSPMLAQIIRFYGHAMQGMMGSYLEKNIQTFTDIQSRLGDPGQGLQPRTLDAVHERPGADGAGPDGQLPGAVEEPVRADAGADGRAGQGAVPRADGVHTAQAHSASARPGSTKIPAMTHDTLAPPTRPAAPAPKIGFVSLGCPKALTDSELILTQLSAEGYATSKTFAGADLVIVNTCGFIDDAVKESLDTIGEALAANGRVIVTGCLGAKAGEGGANLVRQMHPSVLAVTGPHATQEVMDAVHRHVPRPHDPFVDLVPPRRASS